MVAVIQSFITGNTYNNKAFLVEKGVAGIGSECRAFHWCDGLYGRRPLNHDSMEGFRRRLAASIGWNSSAMVPHDPMRIVIFDRKLESRRALLNVAAVEAAIRTKHPEAEVQTVYGEDMDFKQQVQAAASASVFIQMHGASLANWLFLPQGAVGIHIVADPGYAALHHWIREYVRDLPQAPHLLEVTNPDPWRMHVVPSAILQDDVYLQLPEQQKRDFWSRNECPAEPQLVADKCRQQFQPPALPQPEKAEPETTSLASAAKTLAAPQTDRELSQTVRLTSTITDIPGPPQLDREFPQTGSTTNTGRASPSTVQQESKLPRTISLTSSASASPGKPSLQLPGGLEDEPPLQLPSDASLAQTVHLSNGTSQPQSTPQSIVESSEPEEGNTLDLQDGSEEGSQKTVPRVMLAVGSGSRKHGLRKRRPLRGSQRATSLSNSSSTVHKTRLEGMDRSRTSA
ncbi:hypothetical protein WJX84_008199 [Apatococcus fuscideae]|uniref:Glycosyltransferase 61 catalytic domain-containing protein n=1 Tax=Apatococcus fuscideae TaxID=2026836 RepID=A0AAW1RWD6_9CHLO